MVTSTWKCGLYVSRNALKGRWNFFGLFRPRRSQSIKICPLQTCSTTETCPPTRCWSKLISDDYIPFGPSSSQSGDGKRLSTIRFFGWAWLWQFPYQWISSPCPWYIILSSNSQYIFAYWKPAEVPEKAHTATILGAAIHFLEHAV